MLAGGLVQEIGQRTIGFGDADFVGVVAEDQRGRVGVNEVDGRLCTRLFTRSQAGADEQQGQARCMEPWLMIHENLLCNRLGL